MTDDRRSTNELSPPSNLAEDQERAYHALLIRKITTALKAVDENVVSRHEEMMEIKQQIQEHARDLDHVDKANLRQAADMASCVGEHSIEQRRKLTRLLESPYFGRIDCEVTLKRQYKIEKQQFRFMLESALNIQDNILQEELSRASDDKLEYSDVFPLVYLKTMLEGTGTRSDIKHVVIDEIIVPFCRESEYSTAIDRHMLYVAVTRAMHTLTITHTGELTPLLRTAAGV